MVRRYRRFGGDEDLVVIAPARERRPDRPTDQSTDPEIAEMSRSLRRPRS